MAPPIAIIGGGPSGLTLARLLELKGIEYVVYERTEADFSHQGGSLDIHTETGQRALQEANLFDEFKKHARYVDERFRILDQRGKEWVSMGEGRDAPEIDRSALRQILVDSIPKHRVVWNHTLRSVTFQGDGKPILHFTNGSIASGFKLVIGADGAWSKVRSSITQTVPRYSGRHIVEFKISPESPGYELIANKAGHGSSTWFGPCKYVVAQRQGDLSYRVYLAVTVTEDFARQVSLKISDTEATRRLFLSSDFFGDWADEVRGFIQHAEIFRNWPLYYLPIDYLGWTAVPGLTVVGDAAHPALPNGEGVNIAMEDSTILASRLDAHGLDELDAAVQEYEEDMFCRATKHIASGLRMAEFMFHKDSPAAFIQALKDGKIGD
ncbi:hypothetical protein DL768_003713 [Monosporascus sp. mg162]|nr:hypothetical protein DL768_003713 [Monosporascus sp. mg162]